jgi:hypothetical protein
MNLNLNWSWGLRGEKDHKVVALPKGAWASYTLPLPIAVMAVPALNLGRKGTISSRKVGTVVTFLMSLGWNLSY